MRCAAAGSSAWESREDRIGLLHALATLPVHPESVPINALVPISGTVLGDNLLSGAGEKIDELEFFRTVAVARVLMPQSTVRLSAGRESMSQTTQALCFIAGANSVFTGDKLLTTGNVARSADATLFEKLGLVATAYYQPGERLPYPSRGGYEPGVFGTYMSHADDPDLALVRRHLHQE